MAIVFKGSLGLRACLQFGQGQLGQRALSIDQSLLLPACYLRTLGTKVTTLSTFHGHYSSPQREFNPGKPSCTALLNSAPAYLSYDRCVHSHIWLLACDELYRCGQRILCCRKFLLLQYHHLWFEQPFRRTIACTC